MPIQISCPDCRRPLRVPDHLMGSQVRCPSCQVIFLAADGDEAPVATNQGFREESAPNPGPATEPLPRRLPPRPVLEEFDDDDDDLNYPQRRRRFHAPHRGGMILTFGILGIIGWAICAPLCFMSIAAWVMAHIDLKEIKDGRMDPSGEGMTRAGWILGIIGTVLLVLAMVGCMIWAAIGMR